LPILHNFWHKRRWFLEHMAVQDNSGGCLWFNLWKREKLYKHNSNWEKSGPLLSTIIHIYGNLSTVPKIQYPGSEIQVEDYFFLFFWYGENIQNLKDQENNTLPWLYVLKVCKTFICSLLENMYCTYLPKSRVYSTLHRFLS
jgi:hypothetical protein